jgi:hypothetical protein
MAGPDHPIDGQPLLLAAAKGSVTPERLPDLLARVQRGLADRRERYRREYERALDADDYEAFFVEAGHWDALAEEFGLSDREVDGVRRAHAEHLLLAGGDRDRREEFEAALDLREAVVVGR